MLCTIIQYLGCAPARGRYIYILEAENGIIAREEAATFIPVGTSFDLPDDEWSPDTEEYDIACDGCGYEYSKKTIPGGKAECPICGTIENMPA